MIGLKWWCRMSLKVDTKPGIWVNRSHTFEIYRAADIVKFLNTWIVFLSAKLHIAELQALHTDLGNFLFHFEMESDFIRDEKEVSTSYFLIYGRRSLQLPNPLVLFEGLIFKDVSPDRVHLYRKGLWLIEFYSLKLINVWSTWKICFLHFFLTLDVKFSYTFPEKLVFS